MKEKSKAINILKCMINKFVLVGDSEGVPLHAVLVIKTTKETRKHSKV